MIQDGITFNSVKTEGYPRQGWPILLKDQQGPAPFEKNRNQERN